MSSWSNVLQGIPDDGILEFESKVSVLPGDIVDLKIGGGCPADQRQWGLRLTQALEQMGKLEGFDRNEHQLVVPRTPYKEGTKEHAEDEGLHVTLAQGYGKDKEVIPESAALLAGRLSRVGVDLNTIKFLQGRPENDEASGILFYVAADVDANTKALHAQLRAEMGLPKQQGYFPHVALAGIAPACSRNLRQIRKLRDEWARPHPKEGFLKPAEKLERNKFEEIKNAEESTAPGVKRQDKKAE